MLKRLFNCVVLGLILGKVLSFGINRYRNDQDDIHYRIAEIQRQQELLIVSADNPLPALVEEVIVSVVYVRAEGMWSGSGVIIGPHTVLTARHIIQGANDLYIETADGKRHEAIGWTVDEDNDCGLMFFDPRDKFDSVLEFADSNDLQVGDITFIVGSPYGKELFNTVTFGIVSGLNRRISFFGTCGLITSDTAVNPGNSGGPVFNTQGQMIGIVVGLKYGATGLSIIIPSNVCRRLYDKEAGKIRIGEFNSID